MSSNGARVFELVVRYDPSTNGVTITHPPDPILCDMMLTQAKYQLDKRRLATEFGLAGPPAPPLIVPPRIGLSR